MSVTAMPGVATLAMAANHILNKLVAPNCGCACARGSDLICTSTTTPHGVGRLLCPLSSIGGREVGQFGSCFGNVCSSSSAQCRDSLYDALLQLPAGTPTTMGQQQQQQQQH